MIIMKTLYNVTVMLTAVSFIGSDSLLPTKDIDLQIVTNKCYHIKLYRVHLVTAEKQADNFSGERR
jgi:hypothetical protein